MACEEGDEGNVGGGADDERMGGGGGRDESEAIVYV